MIEMLPKEHVLTSCAAVIICAALLGLRPSELVIWAALAAVATVLIDFDHLLIMLALKDRRPIAVEIITHPQRYTNVTTLRDRMHFAGFGILRMKAHFAETLAAALIMLYLDFPYGAPVLISLWVHCATDMAQMINDPRHR